MSAYTAHHPGKPRPPISPVNTLKYAFQKYAPSVHFCKLCRVVTLGLRTLSPFLPQWFGRSCTQRANRPYDVRAPWGETNTGTHEMTIWRGQKTRHGTCHLLWKQQDIPPASILCLRAVMEESWPCNTTIKLCMIPYPSTMLISPIGSFAHSSSRPFVSSWDAVRDIL